MRAALPLLLATALCGCTDLARVYPLDDTSLAAGTPVFSFVRQGFGHGPVTVTMPDGEVLQGEYQVTENASVGFAFSGRFSAVGIGYGSGRPVVVNAVGGRGTLMNCQGFVDIGGHGALVCETNHGTHYRTMV